MGLPTVVALNMVDLARDRQIEIDVPALSRAIGRAGRGRAGQSPSRSGRVEGGAGRSGFRRPAAKRENPLPERFQQRGPRAGRRGSSRAASRAAAELPGRAAAAWTATATWSTSFSTATRPTGTRKLHAAARVRLPRPDCRSRPSRRWPATTGLRAMLDGVVRRPRRSSADGERPHRRRADARAGGTLVFVVVMALLFSSIFILGRSADGR